MKRVLAAVLFIAASGAWAADPGPEVKPGQVLYSPNGDGINDSAVFHLAVSQSENVSEWDFRIQDLTGRDIKQFSGKGAPPKTLEWNGRDSHNQLIPDGLYQYLFSAVTIAGNKVRIAPQELVCDRQAPEARASVEPVVFSPTEGSAKPKAVFYLKADDTNGVHSWLLKIQGASSGVTAKTYFGRGAPPEQVEWEGRNDAGDPAPDGEYAFVLTARDRAGNTTASRAGSVRLDRADPSTAVEAMPLIFSPNSDGVQDNTVFEVKPPAVRKVIETWSLRIQDARGKPVRVFDGTGDPPREIHWAGEDTKGRTAQDGTYHYNFVTVDEAGNRGSTLPKQVILDNTPPVISVKLTPPLMSPNGDGFTDAGVFDIATADEYGVRSHKLEIRNDVGELKKSFQGEGFPPKQFQWAGQDAAGKIFIDGRYTYELTVEDRAGNKSVTAPHPFQIDVSAPVLAAKAEPLLISPNGDHKESLFQISIHDASDIESWRLEIRGKDGKAVREFGGKGTLVSALAWDGRAAKGDLAPDGSYSFVFHAQDVARNAASTPPQSLTVGARIPKLAATASLSNFSPNADGKKDSVNFSLSADTFNKIRHWVFSVLDEDGIALRRFEGAGSPPASQAWLGERDDKTPLGDGVYRYQFQAVDEAGNRGQAESQKIRIDTERPVISARVEPVLFSPNGDGRWEKCVFRLSYEDASPAQSWSLSVKNEGDKTVRVFSGKGTPPETLDWDGTLESKKTASDGSYTYQFHAKDEVDNAASTADQIFKIDTEPPRLTLASDTQLFAPKSDSDKNHALFALTAQDASNIVNWAILILDSKGKEVHAIKGDGRPPLEVRWEGTGDSGVPFPDGLYGARLTASDEVGNEGKSSAVELRLDTSKPEVQILAQEETVPSLMPEFTPMESDRGIVIHLAAEVLFDTGRAVLRPGAYATIDEAASVIRRYPGRSVTVEGHTDNVPIHNEEFAGNRELSMGRAQAVVDYFIKQKGIEAARLAAKGYGESRPIAGNNTPENRQKNRRVEIIIHKKDSTGGAEVR